MTTIQAFIKRHPVLTYYVLTFALSWGGILIVLGPDGIPLSREQFLTLGPVVYLAALAGPSVAGLLLTGLVAGKAGLRELLARLFRWRVGVRWYAVALLATPLLATAVGLVLSLRSAEFLPAILTTDDKTTLFLSGLSVGLMVGFCEELGWTGFAIPQLRRRYRLLATGLIVGFLWGVWHFPLFWESGSFSRPLSFVLLLVRLFSWLPAYRVLMVWVYDRTESLLVAMLMHVSLVASTLVLQPLAMSGVTYILVWAAALWLVAAVVALAERRQVSRQPLSTRAA